jgi:hypothetical protein
LSGAGAADTVHSLHFAPQWFASIRRSGHFMQIVESTVWLVRTARLTLISPRSTLEITLFPMIHIGEPEFFDTVYADAFDHDVALVEGVKSPVMRSITRAYGWVSRSLTLVVQPAYPANGICRAMIVHADLSAEEFADEWRNVPWWLRVSSPALITLAGLWWNWFGSSKLLAKNLGMDDLPRRDEILNFNPEMASLHRVILDARDARLVERLCEQIERRDPTIRRLAVVYGAQHMRAVLHALGDRYGYRAVRSEWLRVFPVE